MIHRHPLARRFAPLACAAMLTLLTLAAGAGCEQTVIREDTTPSAGLGSAHGSTVRPSTYGSPEPSPHTVAHPKPTPKQPGLLEKTGAFLFGWLK